MLFSTIYLVFSYLCIINQNIHEGDDGLVLVVVGRGDVDKHEGLGVPSQGVLHQHGQLVVTVGDELLVAAEGRDHVPQG